MAPVLSCIALAVFCFGAAARLDLWRGGWPGAQSGQGVVALMLGDSRRLLADQSFHEADVYFHSGYYPGIFDARPKEESTHMEEAAGAREPESEEHASYLRPPTDWIDAFGRHFFPTHHLHLSETGRVQEILPWLDFSAALDPHRVETYVVAAYWLRTNLRKVSEAESFLRRGWSNNPDSYAILLELGKLYQENRRDLVRARNIFQLALKKWQRQPKAREDLFAGRQILGRLAQVEEQLDDYPSAIKNFQSLRALSPNPKAIQKEIDRLRALQRRAASAVNPLPRAR